jgi:hypothetical protein
MLNVQIAIVDKTQNRRNAEQESDSRKSIQCSPFFIMIEPLYFLPISLNVFSPTFSKRTMTAEWSGGSLPAIP